jgi:hypothetical protein
MILKNNCSVLVNNLKILLASTLSIMLMFFVLNLLKLLIMEVGANISGFDGDIIWCITNTTAVSDDWSWSQVMWLYFAPYLLLFFLYIGINWRQKLPIVIPPWLQMIQSWAYVLILMYVFFMPLIEVIYKYGVYHSLNWMGVDRYLQIIISSLLSLYFIYKALNVSKLFSTLLKVPIYEYIKPKQILCKLPYIWYIPFAFLFIIVLHFSNYSLPMSFNYFVIGLSYMIIVNTWLISRYDVIVI